MEDAAAIELDTRRGARMVAATACALLALVASVDFVVNPLGYYPYRYFPPLTWSSRVQKVELMRAAPPPRALVLGSSRSMQLDLGVVGSWAGGPAFNASVDSARAEDVDALLGFAIEEREWRPDRVLIGIDPEMFHPTAPPDGRTFGAPEMRSRLRPRLAARLAWQALTSALTFDTFRGSLSVLRANASSAQSPATTEFEADGHLRRRDWEREIAAGTFRLDVEPSIAEYRARFAGLDAEPDPDRVDALHAAVDRVRAVGGELILFVTPLHASLRAALARTSHYENVHARTLALLDGFAGPGVTGVDCSDVASFGGEPDGFVDGAHIDAPNATRLTRFLTSQ